MAGAELATAYVSLVVETKGIAKGVSRHFSGVEKEAGKAGQTAGGKLKSGFVSGVKDLGKTLLPAMGAAALVAGFKDIIGGASELEQSIGGVQAVFEGNADVITKASKEAAKNLGLSRDEYNKLATTLGAGLKNKGIEDYAGSTQNLIKIGGDLAAQFGGSTQEAVEALSSAMRGESDPIEKYGVALNETAVNAKLAEMGVKKAGGTYTEEQKTMARLALITEQTADAQGAFGRESETAAGRQAILAASFENIKTTVGTALLPAFSGVVNAISDFVSGMDQGTGAGGQFKEIALQVKDAVMGVVDFVTKYKDIIIPLAGGILAVVAAMQAWQAITTAVAAVQGVLNAVMAANPIGIIVLAVVGLVAALVLAYKNSETFRDIVNGAWAAVKSAIGGVVGWITGTAWPALKGALEGIGTAATWLWTNAIQPAFNAIWGIAKSVFGWLRTTAWPIVQTVFSAIGKVATWLWNTIIKPYFTAQWTLWKAVFGWLQATAWPIVQTVFRAIGNIATWLWQNIIQPYFKAMWTLWSTVFSWLKNTAWPIVQSVFQWIGDKAGWLWNTIIKPYFTFMWNLWSTVFSWLKNTAWPIVRDAFQWIGDKAGWLWNKGIKPAFDLIKSGVAAVVTAFKNAKASVGKAWDGLLSGIRGPVLTALSWIDGHLIKPINSLLEKVGIAKIPSIMQNIPGNSGGRSLKGGTQRFATGGPVFGAGTATSDSIPAMLSNNEHVWTAREVAKAGGHRVMEWMRRAALGGDLRRILPTYAIGGRVSGLNAEFLRRLGLWNAAMGGRYSVSSGYRSIAEQTILWNRSDKSGRWVARPGSSRHNYGLAADLAPATLAAHRSAAGQHGLIFPMSWEPWHIEPVGIRSGQGVVGGILDAVAEKALAEINALIGRIPGRGVMGDAVRGGMRMFGRGLKAKVMAMAFSDPANVSVPSGLSGSNRQIGQQMAARYGWTGAQWAALEKLWTGESNWNHLARNPSSGAYGIPQSLPASKMASVAGDWRTNPATQIKWGLDYIADRYGSPLAAYNAWLSRNPHWYSGGGRVESVRPFVADAGVRLAPGINVLDNRLGKSEPLARTDKEMLVRLHPDDRALLEAAVERGAARGVGSGAAYVARVGG